MLVGQFLLGMAVNLFVKIPTEHPGSNPPEYFSGVAQSVTWAILHGNILLAIHAGFGLALVAADLGTLKQPITNRGRDILVPPITGCTRVPRTALNPAIYPASHQPFT